MSSGIKKDEWLAALKAATDTPVPPSDALTAQEFGELMGFERSHSLKRLRQMVAAGHAERTRKLIRRADGGVVWVPAYQLVKAQPGSEVAHGDSRGDAGRVRRARSRGRPR